MPNHYTDQDNLVGQGYGRRGYGRRPNLPQMQGGDIPSLDFVPIILESGTVNPESINRLVTDTNLRYDEGVAAYDAGAAELSSITTAPKDVETKNKFIERYNTELQNLLDEHEGAYESRAFQRKVQQLNVNYANDSTLFGIVENRKGYDIYQKIKNDPNSTDYIDFTPYEDTQGYEKSGIFTPDIQARGDRNAEMRSILEVIRPDIVESGLTDADVEGFVKKTRTEQNQDKINRLVELSDTALDLYMQNSIGLVHKRELQEKHGLTDQQAEATIKAQLMNTGEFFKYKFNTSSYMNKPSGSSASGDGSKNKDILDLLGAITTVAVEGSPMETFEEVDRNNTADLNKIEQREEDFNDWAIKDEVGLYIESTDESGNPTRKPAVTFEESDGDYSYRIAEGATDETREKVNNNKEFILRALESMEQYQNNIDVRTEDHISIAKEAGFEVKNGKVITNGPVDDEIRKQRIRVDRKVVSLLGSGFGKETDENYPNYSPYYDLLLRKDSTPRDNRKIIEGLKNLNLPDNSIDNSNIINTKGSSIVDRTFGSKHGVTEATQTVIDKFLNDNGYVLDISNSMLALRYLEMIRRDPTSFDFKDDYREAYIKAARGDARYMKYREMKEKLEGQILVQENFYSFGSDSDSRNYANGVKDLVFSSLKANDLLAYYAQTNGEVVFDNYTDWVDDLPKDMKPEDAVAVRGWRLDRNNDLVVDVSVHGVNVGENASGNIEVRNVKGLSEFIVSKGYLTAAQLEMQQKVSRGLTESNNRRTSVGRPFLEEDQTVNYDDVYDVKVALFPDSGAGIKKGDFLYTDYKGEKHSVSSIDDLLRNHSIDMQKKLLANKDRVEQDRRVSKFNPESEGTVDWLTKFISVKEGGYANDPDDKGGKTNRGVTIKTFNSLYDQLGIDVQGDPYKKFRNLTDADLSKFVNYYYNTATGNGAIKSKRVAAYMTDFLWGSGQAIREVQQALKNKGYDNLNLDGIMGGETIKVINSLDEIDVIKLIKAVRDSYYDKLVRNDTSQSKFVNGWKNRNSDLYNSLITI